MTEKSAASTGPGPDQQTSNGTAERKPDVTEEEQTGADAGAKDNSQNTPSLKTEGAAAGAHPSPKKRRKVNHGMALFAMHPKRIKAATQLFPPVVPTTLLIRVPRLQHAFTVGDR